MPDIASLPNNAAHQNSRFQLIMQMLLFKTGKSFRAIVLAQSLQPYQYGAVIQDIIRESQEIKPALRDLSARRQFQELPLKGSISQKRLAKDQLLSELRPLY